MTATERVRAAIVIGVLGTAVTACGPYRGGDRNGAEEAVSAAPSEIRPCEGPTAIPPAVDEVLTKLESPMRDHCEQHQLGGTPALFVRTMTTVAHGEQGERIATCQWEVFRVTPEPVRHLGNLSICRFRIDGACVIGLDDDARVPPACFK